MKHILMVAFIATLPGAVFGGDAILVDIEVEPQIGIPTPGGVILGGKVTTTSTYHISTLPEPARTGATVTMTISALALAAGSNYMPDPPNAPPNFFQLTSFSTSASVVATAIGTLVDGDTSTMGDNYAGNATISRVSQVSYVFDLAAFNPNGTGYVEFQVTTEAMFSAGTRTIAGHGVAAVAIAGVPSITIDIPDIAYAIDESLELPTLPPNFVEYLADDGTRLITYKTFDGEVTDHLSPDLWAGLPASLIPEPASGAWYIGAGLSVLQRRRRLVRN